MRNILIATLPEDQKPKRRKDYLTHENTAAASGIVAKRRYFSRMSTKVAVPAQPTVRQKVWSLINNTWRGRERKNWLEPNEKLINVYRPKKHDLHSTLSILSFQSPFVRTFNLHSLAYPKMIFGRPKTYSCVENGRSELKSGASNSHEIAFLNQK